MWSRFHRRDRRRAAPGACALPRIIDFYHLWNAQHARAHVQRTALLIRTVLYYYFNNNTHTLSASTTTTIIYIKYYYYNMPAYDEQCSCFKEKKFCLWRGGQFCFVVFFFVCAPFRLQIVTTLNEEFSRVYFSLTILFVRYKTRDAINEILWCIACAYRSIYCTRNSKMIHPLFQFCVYKSRNRS